jgi:hypothetical protein
MKKYVLLVLMAVMVSGCLESTKDADEIQQDKTEKFMKEANAQIGMPAIKNFQERKLAKMLFELRDKEELICYAYVKSEYTGKLNYIGKCVGYGLPYSEQYTNPLRTERVYQGEITLPQPDPNGLFMPDGLSATWLMLIDESTGEPRPVYIESEIIVSPFKLKYNLSK